MSCGICCSRSSCAASEPLVPGLGLGPLVGHVLNPFRIGWYYTSGFVVAEALRDELATLAPQLKPWRHDSPTSRDRHRPRRPAALLRAGARLVGHVPAR